MNAKEYLTQLAQAAELSNDERDALLKVADKEKFAKNLEEGVMMRSDYSRQSDALRTEKAAAEAEKKRSLEYYQSLLDYKANLDATVLNNGQYQQQQQVQLPSGEWISKKELDTRIEAVKQEYNNSTVNLFTMGLGLFDKHRREFPDEPFDVQALAKTATERNISALQAWEEWAGPKRAERSKLDMEARLKAAKEEGAREFATTHKIPMVDGQKEIHPFFDRVSGDAAPQVKDGRLTQAGERMVRDGFLEAWNSSGAAGTSST